MARIKHLSLRAYTAVFKDVSVSFHLTN